MIVHKKSILFEGYNVEKFKEGEYLRRSLYSSLTVYITAELLFFHISQLVRNTFPISARYGVRIQSQLQYSLARLLRSLQWQQWPLGRAGTWTPNHLVSWKPTSPLILMQATNTRCSLLFADAKRLLAVSFKSENQNIYNKNNFAWITCYVKI